MTEFALRAWDVWRYGGVVMPMLIGTAFVLWFALGQRIVLLRRGDRRPLRAMLEAPSSGSGILAEAVRRGHALRRVHPRVPVTFLDEAFGDLEDRLRTGNSLVACLVAMAPLLGLLGTVTGLIETFGSLGASATSAASEGIAGGIVEALYATQMGLAVAVPGLLAGGALRHRQHALEVELAELRAVLAGGLG